MHRVNYHLTDPQHKALREEATLKGTTVAELIRRAVDAYLEKLAKAK